MLLRGDIKKVSDQLHKAATQTRAIWSQSGEPSGLTQLARRLVMLREAKAEAKRAKTDLEAVYKQAEVDLVQAFVDEGSSGIKIAGKNLFLVSKLGCKRKVDSTPPLIEALEAAGLSDLVYKQSNVASIAAHFKPDDDFMGDPNDLLPDELKKFVELKEYTVVGVRS